MHVALFAKRAGFSPEQIAATVHGGAIAAVWSEEERVLLEACEQLHYSTAIDDALWERLRAICSENAILEIVMLAGFYRTVSMLTNVMKLAPEPFGARFPAMDAGSV